MEVIVLGGQHMGLLVVQVLDAVLNLSQKYISLGHGFCCGSRHQIGLTQALQGFQSGPSAQLGELPAAHHLQ